MDLHEYVGQIPRATLLAMSLALATVLGVMDYVTGPELFFSIFYLIPVTLVTLGRRWPDIVVVSLASAVSWFWADAASGSHYSHWLISYWNSAVHLGFFALHAVLLNILLGRIDVEKDLARRDPLTGAANWRHFQEYAVRELARARRTKRPLTVAYIDLENFKAVNDTLGHDAGDDVLRTIVELIQADIRPSDVLARMGGDEFVTMFPETDYAGGGDVLKRMHARVQSELTRFGCPVSYSMGAVTFTVLPSTVDALIKRADEVMYAVKHGTKGDLKHEQWPATPDAI